MDVSRLYSARFDANERQRKERLWQVLCQDFFQQYVGADDAVLDLGAGYCEFINHIRCRRKLAVDLNEETPRYAAADVEVVRTSSLDLHAVVPGTIDVVFVSNFFEHLPSKHDLLATLAEIRRVLAPGGRVLILQPNIRLLAGAYWDFLDHYLPLTERSLVEALSIAGLDPVEVRARFLPYTTKSNLPKWPWLVRLYLRLPPAQWLFGRQAWVVARKPPDGRLPDGPPADGSPPRG